MVTYKQNLASSHIVTRMMATPANHSIHRWINQALNCGGPPHISNLRNLVKYYRKYIQSGMEHITLFIQPPWWSTTTTVKISLTSKDKVAKAHQQQLSEISVQAELGTSEHERAKTFARLVRASRTLCSTRSFEQTCLLARDVAYKNDQNHVLLM